MGTILYNMDEICRFKVRSYILLNTKSKFGGKRTRDRLIFRGFDKIKVMKTIETLFCTLDSKLKKKMKMNFEKWKEKKI